MREIIGRVAEETRKVYEKQHRRLSGDDTAMKRHISMFSHDYFGLDKAFFSGARVLDAGCGNTGKTIIGLYNLGARQFDAFDLGADFISDVQENLDRYCPERDGIRLASGSVLSIDHPDDTFDFVVCHGVLVHLADHAEAETGFRELARVTKPGGYLYSVWGAVGGAFEDCLFPAIREYYGNNSEFRDFIDNISPDDFERLAKYSRLGMPSDDPDLEVLDDALQLFDVDFCTLIQNFTQAPVRLQISEGMIRRFYSDGHFEEPRRLRRMVKRSNIRKFFAGLHYKTHEQDDALLKVLYGSGNLEFLGRKSPDSSGDSF